MSSNRTHHPAMILAAAALAVLTLIPAAAQAQTAEATSDGAVAATLPAMLATSITAGVADPAGKVPTINAVPNSQVTNLDISYPLGLLVHGSNYVYSITAQDNNFTGSCTVSYSLTQVQNGKTVTLDSAKITTFKTAPGNIWLWVATGKVIPNSPGLATLTGSFKCGTTTNSVHSTMILQ